MAGAVRPSSDTELAEVIAEAVGLDGRLALSGGGSKREIGRATDARVVDMRGFSGVVDYDPSELVLTVGAGTPLSDVQELVAKSGQMLAFDPFDHGRMFGRAAGAATVGGVIAAGVSGSLRLSRGAARDHLLGFRAVSGRGELFAAGGKVVKNVTGYDLSKLMAGSWGRLAALTEVTLKVLPQPEHEQTLFIDGLAPHAASLAMARAMGSQAEVAAAAHIPSTGSGAPLTALSLQGFAPSVEARCRVIEEIFSGAHALVRASETEGAMFWEGMRTLCLLPSDLPLWRINVPPADGGAVMEKLIEAGGEGVMDWAGGLLWVASAAEPSSVRAIAETAGGHAMLIRAGEWWDAGVPAFHPHKAPVELLEERVRRSFDPVGVFETGRF